MGSELVVAILFGLGGFFAGRNYERKHPITAEEAKLHTALHEFFKRKKDGG